MEQARRSARPDHYRPAFAHEQRPQQRPRRQPHRRPLFRRRDRRRHHRRPAARRPSRHALPLLQQRHRRRDARAQPRPWRRRPRAGLSVRATAVAHRHDPHRARDRLARPFHPLEPGVDDGARPCPARPAPPQRRPVERRAPAPRRLDRHGAPPRRGPAAARLRLWRQLVDLPRRLGPAAGRHRRPGQSRPVPRRRSRRAASSSSGAASTADRPRSSTSLPSPAT